MAFIRCLLVFSFLVLLWGCQATFKPKKQEATAKKEVPVDDKKAEEELPPLELIPNPYYTKAAKVPDTAVKDFALAQVYMQKKQWGQAEGQLNLMIATYPKLSGLYVNLGIVHIQRQEHEKAEKALSYAIEVNSKNGDAYTQLGLAQREQGKFKEAELTYLKGLEVWPHNLDALLSLGILYDLYMGKFSEALSQYRLAQRVVKKPDRKVKGWILDLQRRIKAQARNNPDQENKS